nr:uncharacterized protein LOC127327856 isoform X4 [Lolium perenne]
MCGRYSDFKGTFSSDFFPVELDFACSSSSSCSSRSFSSMVQSTSSTTRMDRLFMPIRSFRRSELDSTPVKSRSYMSNLRWLAIAAMRLDLPVPGGPYSRYCSRFVKRPRGESGADSASLASKFAWNRSTFFLLTSTQTNSAVYTWSQGLFPFDVLCVASHISDAFKEWQHNIVQTLIYWNLKTILCSCNIKLSPEQIVNP